MTRDEAIAEVERLRAAIYAAQGDLMILIADQKLGKDPNAVRAMKRMREALKEPEAESRQKRNRNA